MAGLNVDTGSEMNYYLRVFLIVSSNISDQTPPQQYRHPSTTKIQPRHKKSFQSSFISPLQKPYAKISNFYNQILTLTIKKTLR